MHASRPVLAGRRGTETEEPGTQRQPALLQRPRSATHPLVAWSGAAALLASVTVINLWSPATDITWCALLVMACTALGVFIPDLLWQRVHQRVLVEPRPGNWPRSLTKLLGLAGSLGCIAILYWLLPEYYTGQEFYGRFWKALGVVMPLWAAVALPYIYFVDRRLPEPQDGLWQFGRLLLLAWRGLSPGVLGQHLLAWAVKGFFLPLMFTYFCRDLDALLHYDLQRLRGFTDWYNWAYNFLYFVDVGLVSMTYLMSLKLTDTQVRSTEPTMLGWVVALLCYEPFWSLFGAHYLRYDNGTGWQRWLGGSPWLYVPWGGAIVALLAVYAWSTLSFGARFSNLTHRGIITSGPYAHVKHPAYLSKGLSWWLISMPFMVSDSWQDSLRRCALLLGLNGIYYLRARTEERHLSADPVYVQYAQWIDAHGLLRFLKQPRNTL